MAGAGSFNYGGGLIMHCAPGVTRVSRIHRKLRFQWLLWRASRNVDVIVNFGRIDYLHIAFFRRRPLVFWFQNPVSQGEVDFLNRYRQQRRCAVFISKHQCQNLSNVGRCVIAPNAVDTDFFSYSAIAADPPYAVFLGRMTANKGVHVAIASARAANIRLRIAGNISNEPGGRAYFEKHVRPALCAECEWMGEVDDQQKRVLLQGAVALLFPIQWDEPFGIVMIESLACGTPVIAFRRASTPEVIEHGRNGFLCEDVSGMTQALHHVSRLSRLDCRVSAETGFSAGRLLENALAAITQASANLT